MFGFDPRSPIPIQTFWIFKKASHTQLVVGRRLQFLLEKLSVVIFFFNFQINASKRQVANPRLQKVWFVSLVYDFITKVEIINYRIFSKDESVQGHNLQLQRC